jgi:sRNA-binding regulator protein Hfq
MKKEKLEQINEIREDMQELDIYLENLEQMKAQIEKEYNNKKNLLEELRKEIEN